MLFTVLKLLVLVRTLDISCVLNKYDFNAAPLQASRVLLAYTYSVSFTCDVENVLICFGFMYCCDIFQVCSHSLMSV